MCAYSGGVEVTSRLDRLTYNRYSISADRIWLDDIQCRGTERYISDCSHSPWGVHNCAHREDVAVHCSYCPCTFIRGLITNVPLHFDFSLKLNEYVAHWRSG